MTEFENILNEANKKNGKEQEQKQEQTQPAKNTKQREAREATMFSEEMTVNHDVAASVPCGLGLLAYHSFAN